MTPRPWYRSRLFWLGLPGLVFLLWGWQDSIHRVSKIWWIGDDAGFHVSQYSSLVHLRYSPYGSSPAEGFKTFRGSAELVNETLDDPEAWFRPFWSDLTGSFGGDLSASIPIWWIVVGYLAIWLPAIIWWQRRKSRLLKLHAAP